jgi:hypothetical protein
MTTKLALTIPFLLGLSQIAQAEKEPQYVDHNMLMDHGAGHLMDMDGGMIMGQNKKDLPPGCSSISEDVSITVHAGHKYARDYPGTMFGFDQHEWHVKPCARLTVNFYNEDNIRHQWMMHGLPKFMYDKGMFHLEMTGPAKITGTLILPSEDKTYLVHCDIAQHMEKGMKAQLIVGKGSVPFPSIPGITDLAIPDNYGPKVENKPRPPAPTALPAGTAEATGSAKSLPTNNGSNNQTSSGLFVIGLLLGAVGTPFAASYIKKRYADVPKEDIVKLLLNDAKSSLDKLIGVVITLIQNFKNKDK